MNRNVNFISIKFLLSVLVIGAIATITMDIWNLVLFFTLDISLDWSLLGRWIGYTLQGDFMLYGVSNLTALPYEVALGWIGHYGTGIVYAATYLLVAKFIAHHKPSLLIAIIVALCFMVMPFLLYQPAVGMGYFAMHANDPNFARVITLSMHTFFGVGLYLGYLLAKKIC